jgi:GGDEF domain-containing protein
LGGKIPHLGADQVSRTMGARLRSYSLCLGGAFWGTLIAWVAVDPDGLSGGGRLPVLVALAVAGEELVMRGRSKGDGDGAALSLSAVAHVAAAILLAPVAAALTAALGVVISDGLRKEGRRYLLINSAMFGGSTWVAATAYRAIAGSVPSWTLAAIPAFLVVIVVRYLATSIMFAGGMAALGVGNFFSLVWRAVGEEIPAAAGEGSMGVLVAFGFGRDATLLPFLLPLLAALFFARANFERLRRETQQALQAMADVIDARDPSTSEHSERVAELVGRFAVALALPHREAARLVAAARFHDLGKIAVDTSTLASAGRLTDAQLAQIRMHPRLSAQLLRPFSFAREIAEFASLHHERWDGTGYFGVSGQQVPIEAHVLVAADSFDAMNSVRPYRPALSTEEAVAELLDKAGTQFHPMVARALAAVILEEPLTTRLTATEISTLHDSFARVPVLPGPARLTAEPRLLAMAALVATLAAFGTPGIPRPLVYGVGALTTALLAVWLATNLDVRRRRRRAEAAITAAATPAEALRNAAFHGVAISVSPDRASSAEAGAAPAERREIESWLRLGAPTRTKQLSTGSYAVRSEEAFDGRYLVLVLLRRPRVYELELATWLADALQAATTELAQVVPRRSGGARAVARIELGAFERLRRGAGQLMAQRVVEETERRLRAVLRASDAVLRLDDDVFAVSLVLGDDRLDVVKSRLRAAITDVPVPHRLDPLDPKIVIATAADAQRVAELAEIEDRLLPAPVPA